MKLQLLQTVVISLLVSNSTNGLICNNGDVRLVGGVSNLEGRVEVCSAGGHWGTVCDDGWTSVDANVVCGQLGHSHLDAIARTGAYFGQGSGAIILDDVDCTGLEDKLTDCRHNGIGVHDCSHYEDAGVVCEPGFNVTSLERNFNVETGIDAIRLINGAANRGRLEVLYNGTWGTVCDDFWSYSDAKVACRMLGYDDAACAVTNNQFGVATRSVPFWMDNVQCSGSEQALDRCSFAGWGNSNCGHTYDDAGVVCRNFSDIGVPFNITLINSTTRSITISWTVPKLPASTQYLRYYISYQSQSMISPSYISFNPSSQISSTLEGSQTTYTLTSLTRDTEYSIRIRAEVRYSACTTYVAGNYSDIVTVRSNSTLKSSNISVRLVSPYQGLDFLGRIEVLYNNQWGTVCDDYFSMVDANVVCRMLNYRGAICTVSYARLGQGTGPIWLRYVGCRSSDEILDDCNIDRWGASRYCSHDEDVGVICQPDNFPRVNDVTVTSVGPSYISIRWTPYAFPSGASSNWFEIVYGYNSGVQQTTTNALIAGSLTEYTLTNLQFEQEYSISIRARVRYSRRYYYSCSSYLYGDYSDEVSARTVESAPSGPPTQFHIEAINETAIEAQWDLPRLYERSGIIRGYRLFVSTGVMVIRTINITNNNTLVYIIGGLEPRTAYTVSILAYTVADGPKSIHLTAVTRAPDHSLLTEFGINGNGIDKVTRSLHSSTIYVHCTPRRNESTNATAEWFFANGTRVGARPGSTRRVERYTNGTKVLVIGFGSTLSYCDGGFYTCVVNDTSGRSEKRTFHLRIGSSPPTPSRPTVIRQGGNTVTIGWFLNTCDGGHIPSYFTIRYQRRSSWRYYYNNVYITVSDPTQRSYRVTGLSYSTSYYFYIQVTTTDSRSSLYSSSAYITTLSTPPSTPSSVTARLVRPLVVRVSWNAASYYRGSISQYAVYATPVIVPEQKRMTAPHVIKKVFPSNVRSANITLTHHSVIYKFQVSAGAFRSGTVNEGNPSPATTNTTIFIPDPGLPKPVNVAITETTNASLTLSWNFPPPPVVDAIRHFLVTYSADVQWRSHSGNLVQFEHTGEARVNGTRTTLSPLIPGTNYKFKVSAITLRGRGEEVTTSGDVLTYQDKLAFFQLRMSPIVNCHSYLIHSENITHRLLMFRGAIVEDINIMCPSCSLSIANIREDEFSCCEGLTNHIIYRAMIIGTNSYSPNDLVSLIQSWVNTGYASIIVETSRLFLDKDSHTLLDTLKDPDCPLVLPPTTTSSVTPPKTTAPPSTTKGKPSDTVVSNAVGSPLRAGDIGGILVALIISTLVAVLLIVLVVTIMKWKAFKKKSYGRADHILVSISQTNRDSAQFDEDDKGEYTL